MFLRRKAYKLRECGRDNQYRLIGFLGLLKKIINIYLFKYLLYVRVSKHLCLLTKRCLDNFFFYLDIPRDCRDRSSKSHSCNDRNDARQRSLCSDSVRTRRHLEDRFSSRICHHPRIRLGRSRRLRKKKTYTYLYDLTMSLLYTYVHKFILLLQSAIYIYFLNELITNELFFKCFPKCYKTK